MFRHHRDPLYYDTNANQKVFVPQINEEDLTEEQKKIVESFPAEDRGKILDDEEYKKKGYGQNVPDHATAFGEIQNQFVQGQGDNIASMVEYDQFTAAAKKHKLKERAKIEK